MKILDVFTKIKTFSKDETNFVRIVGSLIDGQNKLHICDLDMSLILLFFGLANQLKEEHIKALADSKYARYIIPDYFKDDIQEIDDETNINNIVDKLKSTLNTLTISDKIREIIGEHELNNEINLDAIIVNSVNGVSISNNIKLEVKCNDFYSFLISQTKMPIINEIVVSNVGDEILRDIKIRIKSTPDYIDFSDIDISLLNPNEPISISSFNYIPNLEALINLKEKVVGNLEFILEHDGVVINKFMHSIDYFSYDTWLGNYIPETVALFVTPNDTLVQNVVRLTAQKLQQQTGTPSLSDYQTGDKNEVVAQLRALYDVLHDLGIGYITVPPSFEDVGQKIRLPHDVLKYKQGTCIDLAILYSSCAEAMGLHPFINLVRGHAYLGVFLSEDSFTSSVYSDVAKIITMNSDSENEILLIESTLFTAGKSDNFEQACAEGRLNTIRYSADGFDYAVDISVCRSIGYLPLPINFDDEDKITVDFETIKQNQIRLQHKEFNRTSESIKLSEAELDKFDLWEKKLLDLSKRNQLIDYKLKGKGLQILSYDMNDLYNAFEYKGKTYNVSDSDLVTPSLDVLELPNATVENYEIIKEVFKKGILPVVKRNSTAIASLKYFYRERKKAFEESGSNILYLAIGFVSWYETETSREPRYSPIVLVPVDLKRYSKDSYGIVGREEAPFINISIFEYFHQEFKMNFDDLLQTDLFTDDINIDSLLNTVREKIKKIKRATVINTAALNVFNFSKAVMWQDVKYRRNDLAQNKVVKAIIDGQFIMDEKDKISNDFDDNISNPEDLALPLSADSSQIIAIKDCADGKSFILQGPPGTGKSQTITNMIVNTIYHGKTVLFVAEKMAALSVVKNRLHNLKLDQFALEAHSIKSDKASIMEQFEKRIALGVAVNESCEFSKLSKELKEERLEINRVINLLHKENKFFMSFYDAFVHYLDIEDDRFVDLSLEYVTKLTTEVFAKSQELLSRYENLLIENNGYATSPFILYRNTNYIPGVSKRALQKAFETYKNLLKDFLDAYKNLFSNNNISLIMSKRNTNALYNLIKENPEDILGELLDTTLLEDTELEGLLDTGLQYYISVNKINSKFTSEIYDIDFNKNLQVLENNKNKFILTKFIANSKLLKEIRKYAKEPKSIKAKDLAMIYKGLSHIFELEQILTQKCKKYRILFGNITDYKNYDFNQIKELFVNTQRIKQKYAGIFGNKMLSVIVGKLQKFIFAGKDEFVSQYKQILEFEEKLTKELKFNFNIFDKYIKSYDKVIEIINDGESKIDYLPNWCTLVGVFNECEKLELMDVLDYVNDIEIEKLPNLADLYAKSVYATILGELIVGDENGSFNSVSLNESIKNYKQLIDKFTLQTIKETAARVSQNTPAINDKSPMSSEQGVLNKAVKNKCRGKSIRQLFGETQDILTKLFPIFMMSPISCAQYLSPDMPKFDVVIFDEASQMPTSEAIGAIARGNSLIVVGDSKQMPPTSFFKSKGSDDEYVDIDDQDSILDDCDVIGMPSHDLLWHYRSKHESLIRFSNAKYYNNSLTTFPSPSDLQSKVSYVNVHGVYKGDKSKRATNEKEAKAIVQEIARRLQDTELRKRSIGVVTFSSVQQELIEDLLQDYFAKHKDLETFNNNLSEPIIIKNLENIQGDERDVILMSVCYGPDKNNKMYYRFGPINNIGGEKRLNVAVSRARYEMIVFASFEPELLSKMKTESIGAKNLYAFLNYAKYGTAALTIDNASVKEKRSGIEKQIAKKLKEKGYDAIIDVGKSSFRIDVGILDPDNPNKFILGIVCDSYSYENAKTSRDRNIVQPSVLKMLGWNLMRIWSFDYYDNPDNVIKAIIDQIEEIKRDPSCCKESAKEKIEIEFETKEVEIVDYSIEYNNYNMKYNLSELNEVQYHNVSRNIVKEILMLEAPINDAVLFNRFANAIGAARAGSRIQNNVISCLIELKAKKNYNYSKTKTFFWYDGQDQFLNNYRVGGEKPRDMDNIAKEEIFVAIREVLKNNGAINLTDLKSCVAERFGIKQVKTKVSEAIEDAVNYYIESKVLSKQENGRIFIED